MENLRSSLAIDRLLIRHNGKRQPSRANWVMCCCHTDVEKNCKRNMTLSKIRTAAIENRVFQAEWTEKYAFILPATSPTRLVCLICSDTVAFVKSGNLKWHYETKRRHSYPQQSKFRAQKIIELKAKCEQSTWVYSHSICLHISGRTSVDYWEYSGYWDNIKSPFWCFYVVEPSLKGVWILCRKHFWMEGKDMNCLKKINLKMRENVSRACSVTAHCCY